MLGDMSVASSAPEQRERLPGSWCSHRLLSTIRLLVPSRLSGNAQRPCLLMDTSLIPPPRSRSRGKSRSRALAQMANRRDYAIGIVLLLCVVVLWTTSNFVTQVRSVIAKTAMSCGTLFRRASSREVMRSRSCTLLSALRPSKEGFLIFS